MNDIPNPRQLPLAGHAAQSWEDYCNEEGEAWDRYMKTCQYPYSTAPGPNLEFWKGLVQALEGKKGNGALKRYAEDQYLKATLRVMDGQS